MAVKGLPLRPNKLKMAFKSSGNINFYQNLNPVMLPASTLVKEFWSFCLSRKWWLLNVLL